MFKRVPLNSFALPTLLFFSFLLSALPLQAKVEIDAPRVGMGYSMRIPPYTFADFSCRIKNTDNRSHTIMARYVPVSNFGGSGNIFTDYVSVPPECALAYKTQGLIENSTQYRLEVFIDGKKQSKAAEDIFFRLTSSQQIQYAVYNDDIDSSLGSFVQLPFYKDKVFAAMYTSQLFPENWVGLKSYPIVILVNPNYSLLSTSQAHAIIEYVQRGGILVFATPESMIGAATSPLADLLPVQPGKTRIVKEIPEMRDLIPGFKGFDPKGINFLESFPVGDGVDLLRSDEYPLIRWRKYGLGSVRFAAFPVTREAYQNAEDWEKVLQVVFRNQHLYENHEHYNACLDQMTGFTVPGIGTVESIFLVYFLILAVIVTAGLSVRRAGIAWSAGALIAVGVTCYVMVRAQARGDEKGSVFSMVQLSILGDKDVSATDSFFAFFSNRDITFDLDAPSETMAFSGIPPNTAGFLGAMAMNMANQDNKSGHSRRVISPLDIQRDAGFARFKNISISANTSQQFRAQMTLKPEQPYDVNPLLSYDQPKLKLECKIPKELTFSQAYLLLPNGSLPLIRQGDSLALGSRGKNMFSGDAIGLRLRECLDESFKVSSPCLAFIQTTDQAPIPTPEGAQVQGRRVMLAPVARTCSKPAIVIPPEDITLTHGDAATRMIIVGNTLSSRIQARGSMGYNFRFELPPVLAGIEPKRITVRAEYHNPGGNIELKTFLSRNGQLPPVNMETPKGKKPKKVTKKKPKKKTNKKPKKKNNKKKPAPPPVPPPSVNIAPGFVTPTSTSMPVYVFEGDEIRYCIDSLTGAGFLRIEAVERDRTLSAQQKLRANNWEPAKIEITIEGELPDYQVPFSY